MMRACCCGGWSVIRQLWPRLIRRLRGRLATKSAYSEGYQSTRTGTEKITVRNRIAWLASYLRPNCFCFRSNNLPSDPCIGYSNSCCTPDAWSILFGFLFPHRMCRTGAVTIQVVCATRYAFSTSQSLHCGHELAIIAQLRRWINKSGSETNLPA